MAKINDLPQIAPETINGAETVPVVKDGATGRATLHHLTAPATRQSYDAALRSIGSNQVFGYDIDPMPGAANAASASYFVFGRPLLSDSLLTSVAFNARAVGQIIVGIWEKAGNDFTLVDSAIVPVSATGPQRADTLLRGRSGQYVGFYGPGIVEFELGRADNGGWFAGSAPDFTDDAPSVTTRLHIRIEAGILDRLDALEALVAVSTETKTAKLGKSAALIETANKVSLNTHFVLANPSPGNGKLTQVEFFAKAAHTLAVGTYRRTGDTFTLVEQRAYAVPMGLQTLPLDMSISAGDYVGFVSGEICFDSTVLDPTGAWYAGSANSDSFVDNSTSSSPLQFRAAVSYAAPKIGGAARPRAVDVPFTKGLVIGAGQSLMEGSTTPTNGIVPITTAQIDDNSSFPAYPAVAGDLLPATVANSQRPDRGEWSGLGMMARLREVLEGENNITFETFENRLVAINTAQGGRSITQLNKGTANYASGIAAATRLAQIDPSSGVLAVCWGQGEQDGAALMPGATYLAHLKQLARDYDADLRAATGQSKRVPLITYQVSAASYRGIGLMHLQASIESDLIFLCCPMYQFNYYDSVHIDAASERLWGAYQARAIKSVVYDGENWEPLRPIACRVLENSAVLTFNKPALAFDTALIPAQPNNGFKVLDDAGNPVAIASVAIQNQQEVKITCSAPFGEGFKIKYGDLVAVGRSDAFRGACGNLRDSAGDNETFDGKPLHNWSVLFDWAV